MRETLGTISIVRLPGVAEEEFLNTMRDDVLPSAAIPGLNRSDNVTRHELRREDTPGQVGTYQWVITWDGVGNHRVITNGCESMFDSVRDKLEEVGTRTGFGIATVEARWDR